MRSARGCRARALVEVPLRDRGDGFACDFDAVADAARRSGAKLVFLCSPGNPTGAVAGRRTTSPRWRDSLQGRALVVVDEAYVEFAVRRRGQRR